MTDPQQQQDLEALQDAIYRDKVLRARAMTAEERLAEAFDLTTEVFQRMHDLISPAARTKQIISRSICTSILTYVQVDVRRTPSKETLTLRLLTSMVAETIWQGRWHDWLRSSVTGRTLGT